MSRDVVLRAALALIDERGVADFNVRELSARLRVFPTAIYWHVPSRDALVAGAVSLALSGVAADRHALTWQDQIRSLLTNFREALRRHPRVAPLVASELTYNQSFDALMLDQVVVALERAGFAGAGLVDAFNVVIAAMCGFATLELAAPPDAHAEAWKKACQAQMETIEAGRTPALHRNLRELRNRAFILRWTSGSARPLTRSFEAWIDVLIRGLESRTRAARTPRTGP